MGQALAKLSAAEFLEWEKAHAERHEFILGEVFAMAGGTLEHNAAALRFASTMMAHLAGTPCRVFMSDVRLRVDAADAYFYPDVVITCSPRETNDAKATTIFNATLIAEVLSPGTAAFDRGPKFSHYRKLTELKEYVLIDPEARTVEVFRKNASAVWELHPADPGFVLESIKWTGDSADLFA
jgi:Uma2 family endonuclease